MNLLSFRNRKIGSQRGSVHSVRKRHAIVEQIKGLRRHLSRTASSRRLVWPTGSGTEIGVFSGAFSEILMRLRAANVKHSVMFEDHAKAAVLWTLKDTPISLMTEPDAPEGTIAVIIDKSADPAVAKAELERLLPSERLIFYAARGPAVLTAAADPRDPASCGAPPRPRRSSGF